MIVDPHVTSYIHSLDADLPDWLENIRQEAIALEVPIIRQEMESFLRILLHMLRPGSILEIGTGIGFSALFMHHCLENPGCSITTIENYEPRLVKARKNLAKFEDITLLEGDAVSIIQNMNQSFDFIFLDGPKAQYPVMFPKLKELLLPGGALLADNVLQDGSLAFSRFCLARRQRTIHERMRRFLWEAKHDTDLEASLLTIGDGVLLCTKKENL